MKHPDFSLARSALGRLVLTTAEGVAHEDVVPVRAFPISAAADGLALMSRDGHELAWVERLADLPDDHRTLIEAELANREFMPEIRRITGVSTFATPSTWHVDTDRGRTALLLKGEEDIRRLPGGVLIITDGHGVQFLIRDPHALDRESRKLLDRFL